jgi:hypothetical protein
MHVDESGNNGPGSELDIRFAGGTSLPDGFDHAGPYLEPTWAVDYTVGDHR